MHLYSGPILPVCIAQEDIGREFGNANLIILVKFIQIFYSAVFG